MEEDLSETPFQVEAEKTEYYETEEGHPTNGFFLWERLADLVQLYCMVCTAYYHANFWENSVIFRVLCVPVEFVLKVASIWATLFATIYKGIAHYTWFTWPIEFLFGLLGSSLEIDTRRIPKNSILISIFLIRFGSIWLLTGRNSKMRIALCATLWILTWGANRNLSS